MLNRITRLGEGSERVQVLVSEMAGNRLRSLILKAKLCMKGDVGEMRLHRAIDCLNVNRNH